MFYIKNELAHTRQAILIIIILYSQAEDSTHTHTHTLHCGRRLECIIITPLTENYHIVPFGGGILVGR